MPFTKSDPFRTVLRWYANPENWKPIETGIGMMPSEAESDGGERAREVLGQKTNPRRKIIIARVGNKLYRVKLK